MEAAEPKAYDFRPYVKDDLNFISNSWAVSFYSGIEHKDSVLLATFHRIHRPKRDAFFQNPSAAIIVCCSKQDPNLIIGWIAAEQIETDLNVLHYIYVKQAFKGEGIAKELISKTFRKNPIVYTHSTEKAERILDKQSRRFIYMPYLF